MLSRAPVTPQRTSAFIDKAGVLTDYGIQVLTEMRKQIAPGFPVVPVSIAGTNTLTMTPTLDVEGGQTYGDGMVWSGAIAVTSTGAVTARVGSLPFKKVYVTGGSAQANNGDLVAKRVFLFVYNSALDTGVGGFVAMN